MSSSTSSSKPIRQTLAFVAAFGLAALVGSVAPGLVPGLRSWRGSLRQTPPPDAGPSAVMEGYSDFFDMYPMLLEGIGPAVGQARRAEVLIVGNSRPVFAFPFASARRFEERTGLRCFNLALTGGDALPMARFIIGKFGLHPSCVVVCENGFFHQTKSRYAVETLQAGVWGGWTRLFQHQNSWNFRCRLHRLLPRFNVGPLRDPEPVVLYQSLENGGLLLHSFPPSESSFDYREDPDGAERPGYLDAARGFRAAMARLGASTLVTYIPHPAGSLSRARAAARAMGVPFLPPADCRYSTFDGDHLSPGCARCFADHFFETLEQLPEVRSLAPRGR